MTPLDLQLKNPQKIDFEGHTIHFVDIAPTHLKNHIPIFIAPGWGETPQTFRDLIQLLVDAGFRVISVTHLRQDLKLITKKNISKLEFQKAEIILKILELLNIKKVNTIAHSEGAINAVIAARLESVRFKNVILVGPGGLVENEPFSELVVRFVGNFIQTGFNAFNDLSVRARLLRSCTETFKYFLTNPVMSLLEGSSISNTHLQGFLGDIHSHGIAITVIEGTEDFVFPLKKMQGLKNLHWIDFQTMSGDHNDLYAHPQKYLQLILKKFGDTVHNQ